MKTPRVTEILRNFTSYQYVPKNILANAAARGSSVHAICAGIAKGVWIPDGMIEAEHLGYVKSFHLWNEEFAKEFLIIEKRFYDTGKDFSGQIDFLITTKDEECWLVDIKTSSAPQKSYPVQMAAYKHLLQTNGITIKGAMIVYLDRDGNTPKVHALEDLSEETRIFMCALDCWHFFNRRKRNVANRDSSPKTDSKPPSKDSGGDE